MASGVSPSLIDEAEGCRQKALAYVGQPEAAFLLRVAEEFDRLADDPPVSPEVGVDGAGRTNRR